MRSPIGVVAAATILLTIPLAVAAGGLLHINGEDVIHFGVGAGFVLLALAMWDFGLARPITMLGSAAAAAFGGIFLLQGVADVLGYEPLRRLAFDVLGHELERLLPDVVFLWFVALLLTGTAGRSRYVGWVVMPVVLGFEIEALAAGFAGLGFPRVTVLFLLPIAWLLIEALQPAPAQSAEERRRRSPVGPAIAA
jgi:hypothetical protein